MTSAHADLPGPRDRQADAATLPDAIAGFRRASEAGDVEGMLDTLAPGAILHSPILDGFRFEGREQLAELFAATSSAYEEVTCANVLGGGDAWVLVLAARIGGQRFQETLVVTLDERERILELTPSIRPLSGATAVASAVGARLARRRGRGRSLTLTMLTAPLVQMARSGDRVAPKLLGVGVRSGPVGTT